MNDYRFRWEYDECPDMSYLEHTEEEYSRNPCYSRDCAICHETLEWRRMHTVRPVSIAVHKRTGRLACRNGRGHGFATRRLLTYEEYCDGPGNPENYVSLGCILERRCQHCGEWTIVDSVWGADLDVDAPYDVGTWKLENTPSHVNDYQREVQSELLLEAERTHSLNR